MPELRTIALRAHNTRDTRNSLVNRPALPPGLFQPLPELESIQAEGFRWPVGEGLELNSHKQVCRIGHNFGGYNPSYYPRKAGGTGSEMRVRVEPARLPSAVTQPVYFANMALLDHRACRMVAESVGLARASPSRRPWLETALFTAPAGNSPLS